MPEKVISLADLPGYEYLKETPPVSESQEPLANYKPMSFGEKIKAGLAYGASPITSLFDPESWKRMGSDVSEFARGNSPQLSTPHMPGDRPDPFSDGLNSAYMAVAPSVKAGLGEVAAPVRNALQRPGIGRMAFGAGEGALGAYGTFSGHHPMAGPYAMYRGASDFMKGLSEFKGKVSEPISRPGLKPPKYGGATEPNYTRPNNLTVRPTRAPEPSPEVTSPNQPFKPGSATKRNMPAYSPGRVSAPQTNVNPTRSGINRALDRTVDSTGKRSIPESLAPEETNPRHPSGDPTRTPSGKFRKMSELIPQAFPEVDNLSPEERSRLLAASDAHAAPEEALYNPEVLAHLRTALERSNSQA